MTQSTAVRTQSIRVALAATLVVGAIYALVCAAVITFATVDLTAQIDGRLTGSVSRPLPPDDGNGHGLGDGDEPERPFGPRVLAWSIAPDGTVTKDPATPDLPDEYKNVTAPQTVIIDGEQVRIYGSQNSSPTKTVVAQSMSAVEDTRRTIVIGTLLIAPFLLVGVFAGAVLIGRRVAAPVEEARRRQLEFTADASHELRTPLSVIEAHTSLALAQERDAEWYRSAFEKVGRESKRMHTLLEDMLWLARFDAAREIPDAEQVDLATIVRQTTERFSVVAETRHLALSVDAPPAPVIVSAPAELLDRLVGVLIDNACKYAPEGGRVGVVVETVGGHPTLNVDDSGPGISDEDRERIFDRFHRSVDTAGKADGAGLGLAIADAVVKATRGKWSVSKSPLGGARFTVRWPSS